MTATPSVNVPAEREKLRRLRNEINAAAQARLNYERNYTARGYRRAQLPDLQTLDAKRKPGNGETPLRTVCAGSALGIPVAEADMPEAQTSGCGRCGGAGRMGGEGVKA